MRLAQAVFLWVLILTVGALGAGLVGGYATNDPSRFNLGPTISFTQQALRWLLGVSQNAQKQEENPEPFADLASRKLKPLATSAQQTAKKAVATPDDPRLAPCPTHTRNQVSEKKWDEVKDFLKLKYTDLSLGKDSVQGVFGEPACILRRGNAIQWRYLMSGGRIADFTQVGSEVTLKVTNP